MRTELERTRHTRELMERAAEQGLAHERGGDYFWNPGCSAQDVDWDRPMEDDIAEDMMLTEGKERRYEQREQEDTTDE